MKMMKLFVGAGILLLAFACGAILYSAAKRQKIEPAPPGPRTVKVFTVSEPEPGGSELEFPGTVEARRHADLFFRVSGPIQEIEFEIGSVVKAGTVLMRIDPRDYERQVENIRHQIEIQEAELLSLEEEYKRQERLRSGNATSVSSFEKAKAGRDATAAQVKALRTQLKVAQDKLSDTELKAPFDGSVSKRYVECFEVANAYQKVLTFNDLSTIEIKIDVPETVLPDTDRTGWEKLKGMKIPVSFPSRGTRRYDAVMKEFSAVADSALHTYELTLSLRQPEDCAVLPGMTAIAHRLPGRNLSAVNSSLIRLPVSSVTKADGRTAVWKIGADGTLSAVDVELAGSGTDSYVFAKPGTLRAGDEIVAAGAELLHAGQHVVRMKLTED